MVLRDGLNILSSALLITGVTIGIGIFGLPIKLGLAGIIPSFTAMLLTWAVMYMTGWIIVKRMLEVRDKTIDLPGLFHSVLGTYGKVLTIAGYLILLYGCMVAHLAAGASVLSRLIDSRLTEGQWIVLSFTVATGLSLLNINLIRKANAFLLTSMAVAFLGLIYLSSSNIDVARYQYMDWHFLPATIPVVATALTYHPIIPSICRGLNFNCSAIKIALLIGTLIPLCTNTIWSLTVIGALPLAGEGQATILFAFNNDEPATVPLAQAYANSPIEKVSMVFSILALTVSYVLQGKAMLGFFEDILSFSPKLNARAIGPILTFVPPFLIVMIYPNLFLKALDLVGGVSIMLLFGILPALTALKDSNIYWRRWGFFLLIVASLFMGLELMQEFGLLHISPDIEYWPIKNR